MSQRIVFELLNEFQDGATRSELTDEIEETYPERSLSAYVAHRLSALIEKGAVLEETGNGKTVYKVNSAYSSNDLSASLFDFDKEVSREDLESHGIEVTNIVGNGRFCDSIDLQQLGTELANVEYEPETSPMAVWRPFDENAVTVLIPSTGRITIVGSADKGELRETIDEIYAQLDSYAADVVPYETFCSEFQINNIATTGSLQQELELSAVAIGLGLEKTEYEPDQFPGIVYRPKTGVVTLLFRSGNVVITANSYAGILEGWNTLCEDLADLGLKVDT